MCIGTDRDASLSWQRDDALRRLSDCEHKWNEALSLLRMAKVVLEHGPDSATSYFTRETLMERISAAIREEP